MKINFDPSKAVQAAAVLLRAHPGCQMDMLRLLKLLYIADREALRKTGVPIIGNRPVAMDNGPLHSAVYDLIKGEHPQEALWSRYIRKAGYALTLDNDPGVLELSKLEIRLLNEVAESHANLSDWDLVELTHTFPEWQKNHVEHSSHPIPIEDILDGLELAPEHREAILNDLKEIETMDRIFPHRHVMA